MYEILTLHEAVKGGQRARKMRNERPTKHRRKAVHWPQDDHNEIPAWWDVASFISRSSRSRSVDICRSLAYATSSDAHWCRAPVSIDTKGKRRFCHCAKPKPAIFVSQLFYALYTLRGKGVVWEASLCGRNSSFHTHSEFWRAEHHCGDLCQSWIFKVEGPIRCKTYFTNVFVW